MKALSIRQPWAELILQGTKPVENRTWGTSFRGNILIHVSQTIDKKACKEICPGVAMGDIQTGCILGVGRILEVCQPGWCPKVLHSIWRDYDQFGWYLTNVERFEDPIPYKGQLRLFNIPDSVVQEALAVA